MLTVVSVAACERDAPPGWPQGSGSAPAPAPAMAPRSAPPAPARARPTPEDGALDPRLVAAYEELRSCNYRGGVLDYQCAAARALEALLRAQERKSRAQVRRTLGRLLTHAEERIRLAAARHLAAEAVSGRVQRRLVAAYGTERSPHVRGWLLLGLRHDLAAAVDVLIRALQRDPVPAVRSRAARRLGSPGFRQDPRARQALARAVREDRDPTVRAQAAEALGFHARTEATEAILVAGLADRALGPHCALGLARMRSRLGYDTLWTRLQTTRSAHPVTLWALAEFSAAPFADQAAVIAYLSGIARDARADTAARHFAVRGLGRLGQSSPAHRAAVAAVLRTLQPDRELRVSVTGALTALGGSPKDRGLNGAGNPPRP